MLRSDRRMPSKKTSTLFNLFSSSPKTPRNSIPFSRTPSRASCSPGSGTLTCAGSPTSSSSRTVSVALFTFSASTSFPPSYLLLSPPLPSLPFRTSINCPKTTQKPPSPRSRPPSSSTPAPEKTSASFSSLRGRQQTSATWSRRTARPCRRCWRSLPPTRPTPRRPTRCSRGSRCCSAETCPRQLRLGREGREGGEGRGGSGVGGGVSLSLSLSLLLVPSSLRFPSFPRVSS